MKKYILIFITLLFLTKISAQTTDIKGVVKDSTTQKGINGVVVKAIVKNKMLAFAITDKKGNYQISFNTKATKIFINFRHLSYKEKTKQVKNKSHFIKTFLVSKEVALREVVIKAPDVRQRKDTVSFSVKAFQGAGDRSIEDVIKKLPGVVVSKSGQISYQGKGISQLNIEGLDMMGGKYSLATKNIEAKKVSKVEIMENFQKVKQLQGKEYSQEVAMNLKLTKEAKMKIMGTLELGGGYSLTENGKFHIGANAMAFKKKYQFLAVAKTNNLGKSLRPELQDHFGFSSTRNVAKSLFSGELGSNPPIPAERYWRKHDLISSVNAIRKINDSKTLKVSVDYLYDKSNRESFSTSNYFLKNQYITQNENIDSHYLHNKIRGKIGYKINSSKLYLENSTSFGGENNKIDNFLTINNNDISQKLKNRLYHLSNGLHIFKRLKKHQIGFYSSLNYSQLPNNKLTFDGVKEVKGDFYQISSGNSFSTNNNFSLSRDIGRYSRLSVNVSLSGDFDKIKTHLQKNDTTSIRANKGSKISTTISPNYAFQSPTQRYRLSVSLPIAIYKLDYKNDFLTKDFKFNKSFINPSISGHYIFTLKWKVHFGGGLNYSVGDISNFILQPIQTSYRHQNVRSGILAENQSLSGMVKLIYKNPIELFFADASVRYGQNSRNIISNQQFGIKDNFVDITSKNIANKHKSESFSANGYVSKKVRSLRTTFSSRANYGLSFGKSFRQGVMSDVTNHSFSIFPHISTDITKKFNISYSAGYSQNTQFFGKNSTTYHQQSHAVHLAYEFLKNTTFSANWDFTRRELRPKQYKNMSFVDCNLRYKNKTFEAEIQANNLLNLKEYSYTIFSEVDQFSYRYDLRGREIIGIVKFNF